MYSIPSPELVDEVVLSARIDKRRRAGDLAVISAEDCCLSIAEVEVTPEGVTKRWRSLAHFLTLQLVFKG